MLKNRRWYNTFVSFIETKILVKTSSYEKTNGISRRVVSETAFYTVSREF